MRDIRPLYAVVATGITAMGIQFAQSADWPQYRGATHNGVVGETILKTWPASPKEIWKVPTTDGFSSFAVAEGLACTQVKRDGKETLIALNAADGKELWKAEIGGTRFDGGGESGTDDNNGGDGPRSTPTIDHGRVYTLSGFIVLSCHDAKDGKLIWSKDLRSAEFGGRVFMWQAAASPLLDGDLIFVNTSSEAPNSALVAFNKKDGSVAWKNLNEKATHATPILATILGVPQVVFFTQSGLVSVEPKTGKLLWKAAFPYNTSTAASPVVDGDIIYCSAGYGMGSAAFKIAKNGATFTATQLWRKKGDAIANHWSTPVAKDGFLYGIFEVKSYGTAPLKCVNIATGEEKWSERGFGPGGVVLVNGNVLVLSDTGKLVLVEAKPDAYKALGEYKAISGKCWNTFAVSNGRLYVRSTKEGACIDVSGK
jgi:outer membrane protein assembly factor BamB